MLQKQCQTLTHSCCLQYNKMTIQLQSLKNVFVAMLHAHIIIPDESPGKFCCDEIPVGQKLLSLN